MRFIKSVLFGLLIMSSPVAAADSTIELAVGSTHVITMHDVTDIVVGDDNVAQVHLVGSDTLIIKGLKPGVTEILLRLSTGLTERIEMTINGVKNETEQTQLNWIKANMPGLSVTVTEGIVIIAGELNETDHQLLLNHAQRNPDWLLQITKPEAALAQMIELEVKILEVKRHHLKNLGLSWPSAVNGPLITRDVGQWLSFPVAMQSTINLLEQNGSAKVLAEPKLTAASGGQAEFLVGGEFPVPQVVAQGLQDVDFREYGITLTMSPEDLGQQRIATSIKAEISTIDPATSVNGIPGMLTRRVSSMITAASGESIVLSGLISHEQSYQADVFPFLHQLPIVGRLFTSKEFRDAETELVVVVTPTLNEQIKRQSQRHSAAQRAIQEFREQASCVGLIDGY
ncbi:type II and III secretion system protein family protein [Pseudidiomarina sp.]|uniref:type II and III secretion system protein family protein n=1 Tax=Pseudidiomarina sp. TaxID=2081707 RepID=UPI003A976BFC